MLIGGMGGKGGVKTGLLYKYLEYLQRRERIKGKKNIWGNARCFHNSTIDIVTTSDLLARAMKAKMGSSRFDQTKRIHCPSFPNLPPIPWSDWWY